MVNQANTRDRIEMTMDNLHEIVQTKILDIENGTIQVFWKEFCKDPAYKKIVNDIIATGRSSDTLITRRLLEYEYIRQKPDGNYEMYVPLFAQWIEKNRTWFDQP